MTEFQCGSIFTDLVRKRILIRKTPLILSSLLPHDLHPFLVSFLYHFLTSIYRRQNVETDPGWVRDKMWGQCHSDNHKWVQDDSFLLFFSRGKRYPSIFLMIIYFFVEETLQSSKENLTYSSMCGFLLICYYCWDKSDGQEQKGRHFRFT